MSIALGPYQLLTELGRGGLGTVAVALHRGPGGFERLVVVKRIHRHLVGDPELIRMSRDEAHLASKLRHPNVVPVIDVVEQEGELALVMDYVEGVTLATLLRRSEGGRLPAAIASRIVLDALAGLHAAHEARGLRGEALSIVHRDVSPDNLLVGVDGVARVIDFGIAKASRRHARTETGHIKGKLEYMAPEQVESAPVDRRTDVFAAGLVLFEATTGTRVFEAESDAAALRKVLSAPIPTATSLVPDLPTSLDDVFASCLSRAPDARPASAALLAERLEKALPPATHRSVATYLLETCEERLLATRDKLASALAAVESGEPQPPRDGETLSGLLLARSKLTARPAEARSEAMTPPHPSRWASFVAFGVASLALLYGGVRSMRDATSAGVAPAAASEADRGTLTPVGAASSTQPAATPTATPPQTSSAAPATPTSLAPVAATSASALGPTSSPQAKRSPPRAGTAPTTTTTRELQQNPYRRTTP